MYLLTDAEALLSWDENTSETAELCKEFSAAVLHWVTFELCKLILISVYLCFCNKGDPRSYYPLGFFEAIAGWMWNGPNMLMYLNIWFPVDSAEWEGLEGTFRKWSLAVACMLLGWALKVYNPVPLLGFLSLCAVQMCSVCFLTTRLASCSCCHAFLAVMDSVPLEV